MEITTKTSFPLNAKCWGCTGYRWEIEKRGPVGSPNLDLVLSQAIPDPCHVLNQRGLGFGTARKCFWNFLPSFSCINLSFQTKLKTSMESMFASIFVFAYFQQKTANPVLSANRQRQLFGQKIIITNWKIIRFGCKVIISHGKTSKFHLRACQHSRWTTEIQAGFKPARSGTTKSLVLAVGARCGFSIHPSNRDQLHAQTPINTTLDNGSKPSLPLANIFRRTLMKSVIKLVNRVPFCLQFQMCCGVGEGNLWFSPCWGPLFCTWSLLQRKEYAEEMSQQVLLAL